MKDRNLSLVFIHLDQAVFQIREARAAATNPNIKAILQRVESEVVQASERINQP